MVSRFVRALVRGADQLVSSVEEGGAVGVTPVAKPVSQSLRLAWCVCGLLVSYLVWGFLQERIMTQRYSSAHGGPAENFKNSLFLVFMNRILAFVVGGTWIALTAQPHHTAPLYKYSYSSFSNIMSSWCQYEALKFVSFPTQVLAKASKVIPVMLMGRVVSGKTFQFYEYVSAVLISVGVTMFLLTSKDSVGHGGNMTTASGVILLVLYLIFDAFTANWQGELFSRHRMSSIQMMVGVNFFSVLFTGVSLIEQGGFIESVSFMTRHTSFVQDVLLLSLCSATGQLFIFYTIGQFGAVTFIIIMTTRQALAIFLSCIVYLHPISAVGGLGLVIVFFAVFIRIYCNQRQKALKALKAAAAAVNSQPKAVSQ